MNFPMTHTVTAAAVQMNSGEDKAGNCATAERLVRAAVAAGAALIVLPEYFNCLGDRRRMLAEAEPLDGPTASFLRGLARSQANTIDEKDLLIAVSFHPYAPETVELTEIAARNGAKILSISDSRVSPIAKPADIALQVHHSEVRSFRSLAASMCLAQAVVIGFAFDAESNRKRVRKK